MKGFVTAFAVLTMTGWIALPAVASAHTLKRGDAALYSRIEASDYFEYVYEVDSDILVTYPKVHKYDCSSITRHVVECDGSFEIHDYAEYGAGEQYCEFSTRVRYRSHRSSEPVVRILGHDCY